MKKSQIDWEELPVRLIGVLIEAVFYAVFAICVVGINVAVRFALDFFVTPETRIYHFLELLNSTIFYVLMAFVALHFLAIGFITLVWDGYPPSHEAWQRWQRSGYQEKDAQQLRDIAISMTYLKRVKIRYSRLSIFLLISGAAFYALVHVFELGAVDNLVFAPLTLCGFFLLKEAVLEYRIKNGVFGTNAYEVRAIITFLLENAEDIDFTDSSGKPKRVLLPEKLADERAEAIPAQEAKA